MPQRVLTIVLLIGLFFGLITLVSGMSAWRLLDRETGYAPKQAIDVDHPLYVSFAKQHPSHPSIVAKEPLPIDYSHRLHAGELGMNCRFCHTAAEKSRHAGIPSSDVCMKCHKFVTTSFDVLQDEMKKRAAKLAEDEANGVKTDSEAKPKLIISDKLRPLYHSLGLDDNLQPRAGVEPRSMPWVRVHNLPDFVYFDHRAHVTAGVACQHCHGPVESMQRVRQHASLSMGWCVNCHRDATENGINGTAVQASIDCAVCHY